MPIRPLAPELVSHLAAGEVVDRPASLVKELVENALDAAARSLRLEIEQGGVGLVRLTDDGHGIRQEDVPWLLQRHSTSKIRTLEELQAIGTLGFRGEALYSIAAVTRFRLLTQHRDEETGTELLRDDASGVRIQPWAGPVGTTIEVRDLFYNLPARRKFLRGPGAEYSRIAEVVSRYALARPEVRFELSHNQRRLLQSLGTSPLDPLIALYGPDIAGELLEVHFAGPGILVTGFVSAPGTFRPGRKEQTLIVNGRWVKDHTLMLALERAYGVRLPAGKHPLCVLYVGMPPEEVDVNVHPHKTEVRFADPETLQRAIYRATEQALAGSISAPVNAWGAPPVASSGGRLSDSMPDLPQAPPEWDLTPELSHAPVVRQEGLSLGRVRPREALESPVSPSMPAHTIDNLTGEVRWTPAATPAIQTPLSTSLPVTGSLQFGPGLLAYVEDDTLVVVDLPALHARVLYEQLREESAPPTSQPLLFALPLEVPTGSGIDPAEFQPLMQALGFEFSDDGTQVTGLPALLGQADPMSLVRAVVESCVTGLVAGESRVQVLEQARRQAAFHGADRSSRQRAAAEIAWLTGHLQEWRYCTSLTGQPTILRLDPRWWAQMFGH